MREFVRTVLARLDPKPPRELRSRHTSLTTQDYAVIERALRTDYFPTFSTRNPDYLSTATGRRDLEDHLRNRLVTDRKAVVPWLNSACPLRGATVLEIGCGTGASTVAIAEQGARVTALELNARHLDVARARCAVFGVDVEFLVANARDAHQAVRGATFDFVIFFATLEHMTQIERLSAIQTTFDLVRPGGCWAVVEAPNRLWYFDSHTSELPFFLWLPDDLAMGYRRFSPREEFAFDDLDAQGVAPDVAFARWGRGVSYHEFDLALGPADKLHVHSSLYQYMRRNPARRLSSHIGSHSQFRRFLRRASGRDLHEGFFEPYLNLIIVKD
jgi:2-polyprenyl-3-methyl-5-hydroxy-6-metoxy-1,4-benzoquinol methylase